MTGQLACVGHRLSALLKCEMSREQYLSRSYTFKRIVNTGQVIRPKECALVLTVD